MSMPVRNNLYPKVSIVIPVYNGSEFLKESIESALAQTYKNIEVIVVNDGSNDGGKTEKIAKSYEKRIKYYRKENGGVSTALNLGIKKMTGEYFSWLSHDDVYYPDKIYEQMRILKNHRADCIIFSNFECIDSRSRFIRVNNNKIKLDMKFKYSLIYSTPIHGCTVLVPVKCFNETCFFDETLKTVQDYDLWFKFSDKYKFIYIDKILVKSRLHENQGSVRLRSLADIESFNFRLKCINSVDDASIENRYKEKIPVFYISLAYNFSKNNYFYLAFYTSKLSFMKLRRENFFQSFIFILYNLIKIVVGLNIYFMVKLIRILIKIKKKIIKRKIFN